MYESGMSWTSPDGVMHKLQGGYASVAWQFFLLESRWFELNTTRDKAGRNLDATVAHEIEHLLGGNHTSTGPSGVEYTAHELKCSGS